MGVGDRIAAWPKQTSDPIKQDVRQMLLGLGTLLIAVAISAIILGLMWAAWTFPIIGQIWGGIIVIGTVFTVIWAFLPDKEQK